MQEQKNYIIKPCTRVYFALLVFTFTTYFIAMSGLSGIWTALAVLGLALIKGQLIADYFMGLRSVSGIWRWVILLWLFILGGLITTAFYMAS